jgi:hypothetical protein
VTTNHKPEDDDILMILRPLGDPLERSHGIRRSSDYRLKLVLKRLLRDFGFRCVRVGHNRGETPPTPRPT